MFLHLLVDEGDGLLRYVAAVIIETFELTQQGKQRVAYATAQLVVVADFGSQFMQSFEVGYFGHFSFEVGAVFEEVALVELVEFVPDFLAAFSQLLVLLGGDDGRVFGE